MLCPKKNSYLQSVFSNINPKIINRSVNLVRQKKLNNLPDDSPNFQRLASQQPFIPNQHEYDPARKILPYGELGLPLLRRDLQNVDPNIVLRSLSTMTAELRNPEKALEAIRLKIPDRLITVAPREEQFIRERCCRLYDILAHDSNGKDAIANNPKILDLLLKMMKDEKAEVRMNVAACLSNLSSSWMIADILVDSGFIKPILDRLGVDPPEITGILLETLKHLAYGNGKYIAIEAGAFYLLVNLLDTPDFMVRGNTLDCLMILTSTTIGKHMALKCNLLKKLVKLLYEDERLYKNVASVLIFCTILVKSKQEISKFNMVPSRLVTLCRNHFNPDLQLVCLKVLTNIAEHPDIRRCLFDKHLSRLKKIQVTSKLLQQQKDEMIRTVTWDPCYLQCSVGDQVI